MEWLALVILVPLGIGAARWLWRGAARWLSVLCVVAATAGMTAEEAEKPEEKKVVPEMQGIPMDRRGQTFKTALAEVTLIGGCQGRLPIVRNDERVLHSKTPVWLIWLEVKNITENRKITFATWRSRAGFPADWKAHLKDEHGNDYTAVRLRMGDALPTDNPDTKRIDPGKTFTEALIFEQPLAVAKKFTLTLPLANVEGKGTVTLSFNLAE